MVEQWAVQRNLIKDTSLEQIREACKRLRLYYTEFTLIPFSDELPNFPGAFYYGSTTILKHTNKHVWIQYDHDAFSMTTCADKYGWKMLNHNLQICSFKELYSLMDISKPVFVKPNHSTKRFVGQVIHPEDFENWTIPEDVADWDGQVIIAPAVRLTNEYRMWIVDGKVVASSQYRVDGEQVTRPDSPNNAKLFAASAADVYSPSFAFVMDICEFDRSFRIVEVNSINSSGFYDANVYDIVKSLM